MRAKPYVTSHVSHRVGTFCHLHRCSPLKTYFFFLLLLLSFPILCPCFDALLYPFFWLLFYFACFIFLFAFLLSYPLSFSFTVFLLSAPFPLPSFPPCLLGRFPFYIIGRSFFYVSLLQNRYFSADRTLKA